MPLINVLSSISVPFLTRFSSSSNVLFAISFNTRRKATDRIYHLQLQFVFMMSSIPQAGIYSTESVLFGQRYTLV